MKNNEVLVFLEFNLIPYQLTNGWRKVHKYDPVRQLRKRCGFDKWAAISGTIFFVTFGILFLIRAYLSDEPYNFVMSSISLGVGILMCAAYIVNTIRETPFIKFMNRLMDILTRERGWTWRKLLMNSEESYLTATLSWILCYRAAVVKYAERTYDVSSPQALQARWQFDNIHSVAREADLVEEKKDGFYTASAGFEILNSDLEWMAGMKRLMLVNSRN